MQYQGLGRAVSGLGRGITGRMLRGPSSQRVAEREVDAAVKGSAMAQKSRLQRDLSLVEQMGKQDDVFEQQEIDMKAAKEDRQMAMMDPAVRDQNDRMRRAKDRNANAYKRFINRMLMMRRASLAGENLGEIEDPLEDLDDAMGTGQYNQGGM